MIIKMPSLDQNYPDMRCIDTYHGFDWQLLSIQKKRKVQNGPDQMRLHDSRA